MKITTIVAITGGIIVFLICFSCVMGVINHNYEICNKEVNCYKTECSFWGCREIKVDINSAQCEIKKEECKI